MPSRKPFLRCVFFVRQAQFGGAGRRCTDADRQHFIPYMKVCLVFLGFTTVQFTVKKKIYKISTRQCLMGCMDISTHQCLMGCMDISGFVVFLKSVR